MYTLILLTATDGYQVQSHKEFELAIGALDEHLSSTLGTTIAVIYDQDGEIVHRLW